MAFHFVGGPYDGRQLEPAQLNVVARPEVFPTDNGHRTFVGMPADPNECDRILRGDADRASVENSPRWPYERVAAESGAVEYHEAALAFAAVLAAGVAPLDEEGAHSAVE
jgi:hypothetical protein